MNTLKEVRKWVSIIVLALVSAGSFTAEENNTNPGTGKNSRSMGAK